MTVIPYHIFAEKFNLASFPPGDKPLHFSWCFPLKISASQLWPYIADTSRFNRYLGLAPRQESEKDGKKYVVTTLIGLRQEWVEDPWTWVYQKSMQNERTYIKGIAKTVRAQFFFEPTENGVNFYVNFSWVPSSIWARLFLTATSSVLRNNFLKALGTIENYVLKNHGLGGEALKKLNDPETNVNLDGLNQALSGLKKLNLNPTTIDSLGEFIKRGDEADLFRIRVIELSRKWNLPKKDLLTTCMHGVRQGLLTISWDVICPHCRGVRVQADSLRKLPAKSECFVCDIDFETDQLESIEVVFHVHPSYRKVQEVLFCAAEPAKKDHIQVQQRLAPQEKVSYQLALKEGRHRLRFSSNGQSQIFEVKSDTDAREVFWNGEAESEKIVCGPGSKIVAENKSSQEQLFTLEQLWWKDDVLHPSDVFSVPDFLDIFSRESLNTDVKIALGIQVIMFTDIINSTGFYTSRGDAAAFNEVKQHFSDVFSQIISCEGMIVKTIGDSVMASFANPDDALKAAVQIQKTFFEDRQDSSIRLRISMHLGQVILVTLNEGVDLFGSTVNKAAKLQACAGAGEVSVSNEFYHAISNDSRKSIEGVVVQRTTSSQFKDKILEAQVINCYALQNPAT